MTDRALHDHVEAIRSLGSRLALPLPARTRLLRELREDLEGLTTRLESTGLSTVEARRRAREVLVPDTETLRELERLGMPWYRRVTADLDPQALRRAERIVLAVATVMLLGVEAATLVGAGLLRDPSPFLWPVLGMGAILLTSVLAKAFELWVKGEHARLRRGLGALAALAGCTVGLACTGALVDFIGLATTLEADSSQATRLTTQWLVRDAALLSSAIILSVAGALGWFALRSWIAVAEHAHETALDIERTSKENGS